MARNLEPHAGSANTGALRTDPRGRDHLIQQVADRRIDFQTVAAEALNFDRYLEEQLKDPDFTPGRHRLTPIRQVRAWD